jgi:hypothetical protein
MQKVGRIEHPAHNQVGPAKLQQLGRDKILLFLQSFHADRLNLKVFCE